jgi:signal transduction histidine kinase/ActR/RegA family two-component response regulator
VKAVVVAITDITAIQQAQKAVRASEQRFRRIFDTVAVSLWEEDFSEVKSAIDRLERTGVRDLPRYFAEHPEFVAKAQGLIRVLDVNDATVKMFEARDKNEIRGALPEIFTPESMPVLVEELLAVAEGRTYFEAEALLHTVRGNPLYVFFTMVLPSPEQSFDRVLFSVVDLSERKKAEEQVRKALEEAERAARLKDEFLATLSHELRTPMTAIHGWAQILCTRTSGAEGASNPELARALEVIERNARLQTQMIDDLLDMSRIIAGKIRLEIQTVELDLVAQAAVDAIRPAAEAKGVRLQAICEPAELRADSSRLQQVIYNLLSNAVKFTPKDGKVQVLCRRLDAHVEITVSDTGIGIEPRFLPHVFDRFRQQDATTTRSHRGLGLGLGIVKQLVELHGGRVQAASEGEGKGATFTIHLPVAIALPPPPRPDPARGREHKHLPPAETVQLESNAVDLDLSGISLLVVDDEPDARDLLRRMLQLHNARVEIAGSVQEAMAVLERHPPDVLLSDIGMPGEDGYALIRRLRKLPHDWARRLPAIALTAFVRSEDRTQALRAGFDMHLSKPIDAGELLAAVIAVTRHRVPG